MKIKCVRHHRRVVVTDTGAIIHRTGDGSTCKGFQIFDTDRIIDETNGKRHARYDRVLAHEISNDYCRFCGITREDFNWYVYRAEEGMPTDELTCRYRQSMVQSHVWC